MVDVCVCVCARVCVCVCGLEHVAHHFFDKVGFCRFWPPPTPFDAVYFQQLLPYSCASQVALSRILPVLTVGEFQSSTQPCVTHIYDDALEYGCCSTVRLH